MGQFSTLMIDLNSYIRNIFFITQYSGWHTQKNNKKEQKWIAYIWSCQIAKNVGPGGWSQPGHCVLCGQVPTGTQGRIKSVSYF